MCSLKKDAHKSYLADHYQHSAGLLEIALTRATLASRPTYCIASMFYLWLFPPSRTELL